MAPPMAPDDTVTATAAAAAAAVTAAAAAATATAAISTDPTCECSFEMQRFEACPRAPRDRFERL